MDFRILGPLEVLDDGRRVVFGGAKRRALLALLVIHANEPLSAERLIDELWGEHPPATANKTLQAHVSRLRRALERSAHGSGVVVTREHGYELRIDPDRVDARRFERLLGEGRRELATHRPERAASLLEQSLSLWRGPPLAEFAYERFAAAEIARLDELRVAAMEELIDAKLAVGRHAEVVAAIEPLIAEHPYRERLRGQLMLALYRCDRQAEALQAYQDTRRKLVGELGIEPGERLRELERAVLAQDRTLAIPDRPEPVGERSAPPTGIPFVGRKPELSDLLAGLDDAFAGRGRLFLLVGEPGIGKSRLAEEVAANARVRGVRVLIGRCWEAGGAPAFWPWAQSLRGYVRVSARDELVADLGPAAAELAAILPELYELIPGLPQPSAPESEGARFRLFHATVEFFRRASEKRPLVLILDDLHAADTPSLLLLQFLARELGSMRLLLLAAMRDVDPTPGEPLTALLAEVAREPATRRVSLTGLTERDVCEYVELAASELASPELAAALCAGTEGNPLFVSETIRLLVVEGVVPHATGTARLAIPQTVRDVISRRLARLSSECSRLLVPASVLGREFELDTLAHMAEISEDQLLETLDEAVVARVVSEVPSTAGRLRFAHVLIRDTLYGGLTVTRRVRLHRRAVAALMARHRFSEGPHLAELAHHAIAGGDFDTARTYAARAGDWAMTLLAYEEAERLYITALGALDLAEPSDDRGRCELLLSLGDARAWAGSNAAAQTSFLEAAELARRARLGTELARAAAGYGGRIVWARAGNDRHLVPLLESGLAALTEEDVELRVRLLARLAGALRGEVPRDRRDALSLRAVALARQTRDPAVLACALDGHGSTIGDRPGGKPEQLALATELLDVAERAGDRERIASAHYQRFLALIGLCDRGNAEAALAAATTVAEELRHPALLWQVRAARAMLLLAAGRFTEGEALSTEALALGDRVHRGTAIPTHTLQCYALRDFQGRLLEIEPTVQAAAFEHASQPVFRCVLAHLHARLSRGEHAQRALSQLAPDDFSALPFDNEWLYGLSLLAEACSLLHDTATASVLYRLLSPYADYNAIDTPDVIRGSVQRYLGLLATTTAHWDAAAAHFEDAIEVNARMGFVPWLAHAQRDYSCMLLGRDTSDDRERALDLISRALASYRSLGMDSWVSSASKVEHTLRLPRAAQR
jgi:DNA-binding SARP family transcriptional activator